MKTKKLMQLAMLTTIASIIFVIEQSIPNPINIPGVKLGLANIITVYALYHFRFFEVAMVLGIRILIGAMFSGNMFGMVYSMAGGVLCLIGMYFISKIISEKYIWLCSIMGAILHNLGQIIMAILVTSSMALLAYLPYLMIAGIVSGALTGMCAQVIINRKLKIL